MNWREPATMEETREAWKVFRETWEHGVGTRAACEAIGIGNDANVRAYLAENEPFMPWSKDFCNAVFENCRNIRHRATSGAKYVNSRGLMQKVRDCHERGYTYSDMQRWSGVSRSIVQKVASGTYGMMHADSYDRLENALSIMLRPERERSETW